jgi:hypothetical protein
MIHPEEGRTPVGQLDETLEHCTYVLLFMTKNFVKDGWTDFSSQTALMDAIQTPDKRWSVVPIFTESKRNPTFKVIFAASCLCLYDNYCNIFHLLCAKTFEYKHVYFTL